MTYKSRSAIIMAVQHGLIEDSIFAALDTEGYNIKKKLEIT